MRWAMNQITLHGGSRRVPDDLAGDLAALREGGWTAVEAWLPHWDPYVERHGLAGARRLLDDVGLRAAGGCGLGAGGSLLFSHGEALAREHDLLERRLEQCAALGAPHLVVAPGFDLPERPAHGDLDRAAESLRRAAAAAARFGIRLGIELLARARLVSTLSTAVALAERVAHPGIGVVVDTYHLYAGSSKTEDLERLRDDPPRLTFVHVSDVDAALPRDLWTVPDRTLPGAGGVPNAQLLARIRALGYDGDVSLELFSAPFEAWWRDNPVGAARQALARCTALTPASDPAALPDARAT